MLNILIAGGDGVLTAWLAVHFLDSGDRVSYLAQPNGDLSARQLLQMCAEVIGQKATEGAAAVQERIASRLDWKSIPSGAGAELWETDGPALSFDQVWFCSSRHDCLSSEPNEADRLRALLSAPEITSATRFNFVNLRPQSAALKTVGADGSLKSPEDFGSGSFQGISEGELRELCSARNASCRFFKTSLILAEIQSGQTSRHHPFLHFLANLDALKSEIEERFPDYFEFNALRCQAPAGARVNFVHAGEAARCMIKTEWLDHGGGDCYFIGGEDVLFDAVCEQIGEVYELNLRTAEKPGQLNAVDRLFNARLGAFSDCLSTAQRTTQGDSSWRVSCPAACLHQTALMEVIQRIRSSQNAVRAMREEAIQRWPAGMQRKAINRNGWDLTYYVAGSGPATLVVMGALGGGLHCSSRLIDLLSRSYRVITWALRGTLEPPQPFLLSDQADDLEAVLQAEQISACHLVGWCSGPKIATEFYFRRPSAVLSMIFLSGAFKGCNGSQQLDTPYEQNLESLFRMLDRRPGIAASIMSSVRHLAAKQELTNPDEMDGAKLAVSTLEQTNDQLLPHLLTEFQTEATTLNYARQILDFWSHDYSARAAAIDVPVLFLNGEYDRIASPESAKNFAQRLPRSHYIQLQGATHYCIYDCPALVAELIDNFLQQSSRSEQH